MTETREVVADFDEYKVYPKSFAQGWRMIGSLSSGGFGSALTFAVGEKSKATLSVGLSGTFLANINRWKEQFGNEKVEELGELENVELFGNTGVLVDEFGTFRGNKENWGMSVAMVEHPKYGLCVLKLTGPESEVKAEKERFKQMAESLILSSEN